VAEEGIALELALVGALILVNGFFAAAEMAVVSARRSRLQVLADEGDGKAALALRLKADPDRFLATVQVGVTLVGTLASAVGGVAAIERLEPLLASLPVPWAGALAEPVAVGVVVFTIAYLTLVVGELVPKGLAVRNAEVWARRVASTIDGLSGATRWVVQILTASSRLCLRLLGVRGAGRQGFHTLEDLRMIAEEAREQGVVRGGVVEGALEFHERQVREVVTPRHRIVALPLRCGLDQALKTVRDAGHSRLPVYDADLDDVVGFVYAREVYEAALRGSELDLAKLKRAALVVPARKAATELLAEMRKSGTPLAFAVDEHGILSGLVTIEDLVEVIVGEIPDEHRGVEPLLSRLPDGAVDADGSVPVHELNEEYGFALPESPRYVSVAGLVLDRTGALPRAADVVEVAGHRIDVVRMDGARIRRVRIARQGGPDVEEQARTPSGVPPAG
jgi:putative hemolysin